MKRLCLIAVAALLVALAAAPAAPAAFGLAEADVSFETEGGEAARLAGSHPFAMSTEMALNTVVEGSSVSPDGSLRTLEVELPAGFAGSPSATRRCTSVEFATLDYSRNPPSPICPNASAVGYIDIAASFDPFEVGNVEHSGAALYNLVPPPGTVAKFGFVYAQVPVTIEVKVSEEPPYRVVATASKVAQTLRIYSSKVVLWGDPGAASHDPYRGTCLLGIEADGDPVSDGLCPVSSKGLAFLRLPTSCDGPLETRFAADSWEAPGAWATATSLTHDQEDPPNPVGLSECGALGFGPAIAAAPTTKAASSPTGLDFSIEVNDPNATNPEETAVTDSDIERTEVTLPEGMTVNPSQAEGLSVCGEADLARETAFSDFGAGCPAASKIGSIEVETPLLPETLLKGSLFVATPYENPAGSLLALYVVIKDPGLGIKIAQPVRIETDPATGRIVAIAEDMPQLPFSDFRLHFREGARSPLASPAGCGTYEAEAMLYPWSGGAPVKSTSDFEIITGSGGGLCPSGGLPPFRPGLVAGTVNNAAGSHSPFYVRLSRTDSEQEITHFSIKLPPGVTGKLAGIPFCPEAAIAAAEAREGKPRGGQEEIESPSCPAASEIGRTLAGAGVGPALAYAPGKVYLAGPYNGSQLSIVAITAAKVGPFDLGTVVVREALRINPETAEVFVDATGSDPIPHIIAGIPVHLREIRVYVERPGFTLNPTSCEPTSTASTLLGSGLDFASAADDAPVTVTTRFQAADCGNLEFEPRLSLSLRGATKRSGNPALRAVLRPRPGDANAQRISVALPRSEFLDQGHIDTICTRVQFSEAGGNGGGCPAGSVYGKVTAHTPLLAEPLQGNIYLRANGGERELPDLVLALRGLVDFQAVGFIDSAKGGIRNTFAFVPDAPISKVVVDFYGGKKGLLENSTNICRGRHLATVKMTGHNSRLHNFKAPLRAKCGKDKGKKQKRRGR